MFKNGFEKWFTLAGALLGFFSTMTDPNNIFLDYLIYGFINGLIFWVIAKVITAVRTNIKK